MNAHELTDEDLRLQALRHLSVWERTGDLFYQDIANLICTLCSTKMSAISLVDQTSVRFFVKNGLNVSEISKEVAFCSHTIKSAKPLIVPDLTSDSRFKDNPFVNENPHIRFYAGAPLITSGGYKIGTLCALDTSTKELNDSQIIALEALARQVVMRMEWEKATRKLNSSISNMQVILDSMSGALLAEDSRGEIVHANEQFIKMFPNSGYESTLGQNTLKIFRSIQHYFKNPEETMTRLNQIMDRKETIVGEEIELTEDKYIELDHLPTLDETASPSYLWICRDVTYRKNLEKTLDKQKMQIVSSAKLAALGEMAGGIAHEINNPLSIIQGRSQILSELANRGSLEISGVVKAAKVISDTCERVAKIVRGLRTFAQDGEREPFEKANINAIVQDTLGLCREKFQYAKVDVVVNCSEDLTATCRPVHLSQVMLNLLNNAYDAIDGLPTKWIRVEVQESDDNYSIMVTDSGSGIPEEIQEKIMRPFFTTKEIGKGTGLGLSISRGIIESHHGSFSIDNECANTRFIASLPKNPQLFERSNGRS